MVKGALHSPPHTSTPVYQTKLSIKSWHRDITLSHTEAILFWHAHFEKQWNKGEVHSFKKTFFFWVKGTHGVQKYIKCGKMSNSLCSPFNTDIQYMQTSPTLISSVYISSLMHIIPISLSFYVQYIHFIFKFIKFTLSITKLIWN